jgi:dTDP-4-dehydrorhamnose reductase
VTARERVLVLGGSGLVGARVIESWTDEFEVHAPTHAELDVLDETTLRRALEHSDAQVVLNFVAFADVDGAEAEQSNQHGRVYALNVGYPGALARACRATRKHLVHISTDYAFDGTRSERAYREDDPTRPLCWYARTKVLGEQAVQQHLPSACIARIEMPFTARPHAKRDLARLSADRLAARQPMQAVVDQRITPVFLDDAALALAHLARARTAGIVHVASTDSTTPYEFARGIAARLHHDAALVQSVRFEAFSTTRPARRPQHSWLDVSLFESLFGPGILRPQAEQLDAWAEQLLASPARNLR